MTVKNGNCLTLQKEGNEKKYSFNTGDCSQKKSVVCHLSNVKSTSSDLLPSFPCMSQNSTSRRKRSTSLDEFKSEGLGENEIGKGNIVLVIQETLIYQIKFMQNVVMNKFVTFLLNLGVIDRRR